MMPSLSRMARAMCAVIVSGCCLMIFNMRAFPERRAESMSLIMTLNLFVRLHTFEKSHDHCFVVTR